jgi:7,8-dihydropterin-6-yl-methyl-4-(beta-D-ribofuranosyl)aminobenzene 5'-phosphate synthase
MINLKEAERVEIITLIDNYHDALIASTHTVKRSDHYRNGKIASPLVAEHGLALLIRVFNNEQSHSLLLDAGWSKTGVINNVKALRLTIEEIQTIVLSHGHMDHWGALFNILNRHLKSVPVIVHPDAFLKKRFLVLADGRKVYFPALNEKELKETGAKIIKSKSVSLLANHLVMVTGEIERTTVFEKGIPNAYAERDDKVEPDLIQDDQAIIIHLQGKGLVVVSGCAHAGIINTIRYAQKITGVSSIYAIVGGFHLSGKAFIPIIGKTIKVLEDFNPSLICPMHCTGWQATKEIAHHLAQQFVLSTVGTTLIM